MEILTQIPFDPDLDSLFNRCSFSKNSGYDIPLREIFEEACCLANPKAVYRELFIDSRGEETVTMGDVTFTSCILRSNLDRVERVFPYIVTCGRELDQVGVPENDLLLRFWLEEIRAMILESSHTWLINFLERKYSLGKTARMSPGSGDVNVWRIEQQKELFSLFGDVKDCIGVELTESCLMIPIKSISGFLYQTSVEFQSCMVCHRENCKKRIAPFSKKMWDSLHA
ncbi:MAG: hypothetical protein JSV24_06885 [Bacteroidales bacterium]|nr:MAG: hypothetical protein JSV24_06885 [Bacteroidales bacterium]